MRKQSETIKTNNDAAIDVAHCSVSYHDAEAIVHDVSFCIPKGAVAALIGPNGSGKTSLLRAMLGLIPSRGTITLLGKHLHAVRPFIGYVPQHFPFDHSFPITVAEYMELARHRHCPRSRIKEKIKEVGLPIGVLRERLGNLSGGQLQRVLIAQAILNNPSILFLDEPSSGIDVAGAATFYELIAHLNKAHHTTILLVSHDIAVVAKLVDLVVCINKKLLCVGPPNTALTEAHLTELFGEENGLYTHHTH